MLKEFFKNVLFTVLSNILTILLVSLLPGAGTLVLLKFAEGYAMVWFGLCLLYWYLYYFR